MSSTNKCVVIGYIKLIGITQQIIPYEIIELCTAYLHLETPYWICRNGYEILDKATTNIIENALNKAIYSKSKGLIEIQLQQRLCILDVDCSSELRPIVKKSYLKEKYTESITRYPRLDPPLSKDLQIISDSLQATWEWKDEDIDGWTEYHLETMQQIENGYKHKLSHIELSTGPWFAKLKNRGRYFIEYNYYSLPASGYLKSNWTCWVRRVPRRLIDDKQQSNKLKQQQFFLRNDKHFFYRKYYLPLSKQRLINDNNGEILARNLQCSICWMQFDENNLLESQKDVLMGCEFNLLKYRHLVGDSTTVGLKDCECDKYFHAKCILAYLNDKKKCPNCEHVYGKIIGNQPNGRFYITLRKREQCEGCDAKSSIRLVFEFAGGIQGINDPIPGELYNGKLQEAFLPNNHEGREAAMLTRVAFKRKLLFKIHVPISGMGTIVFGSIELKTQVSGGVARYGWPDPTYFQRFKLQLKQKGITVDQLSKSERTFKCASEYTCF